MSSIVAIVAITHDPFAPKAMKRPRAEWGGYEQLADRGEMLRRKLESARPDLLLTIGNDHFHHLFLDNMPPFMVGKMDLYDFTYENEVREFDLPRKTVAGDVDFSRRLLNGGFQKGVDFAYSSELKLDHAILVPLMFVRPELDLPIVPVLTNCVAPPLPPARRYYEVGTVIRQVIEEIPDDRRIGVVSTGHLSIDVGGPKQFAKGPHDAEWDDLAVEWIANGDIERAINGSSVEKLLAKGNVTLGYLNFLLTAGVAGGSLPTYAEALKRDGPSCGIFAWEFMEAPR